MVTQVGNIFPRISGGAIDTALRRNIKIENSAQKIITKSIGKENLENLLDVAAEIPAFGEKVTISTKLSSNGCRTIDANIYSPFPNDKIEDQSFKSVNINGFQELIDWLKIKTKKLLETGGKQPIKFAE